MPRHRAMLPLALASLLAACAPYRLPQHPHSDGSLTNRRFTVLSRPRRRDHRSVLHRDRHAASADGTVDREFRHEVAPSPQGSGRIYYQTARFLISELRKYPGAWKVRLLIDDELAGVYGFRLNDSARRSTRE